MFEITTDRARRLITARVWGFWDQDTADFYVNRHLAAVRNLGLPPGEHLVLADFAGMAVQTMDTVVSIQRLIDGNRAERIALVAPSALTRLQGKRLMVRPNVRVFDYLSAANDWLFDHQVDMSLVSNTATAS